MRVVSLVPSWTETLIESGVDVVGRTRFCIHPSARVGSIPAVGGTKDIDIEKVRALAPDLILLDREENTREMADALREIAPLHVSHVQSVNDMPRELRALAAVLGGAAELEPLAMRFEVQLREPVQKIRERRAFAYVIWKDPWMCVSRDTFIASMLEYAGYDLAKLWVPGGSANHSGRNDENSLPSNSDSAKSRYPEFALEILPQGAHLLLSSEPFPFAKKIAEVEKLLTSEALVSKNLTYELVDGESYSWFGVRALRFLESIRNLRRS